MNRKFNSKIKKTISGILLFFILFYSSFVLYPKKTEAQWATFDSPNWVTNTLHSIGTWTSTAFNSSGNYKEYVLDPLVTDLMQQVIQTITSSIVNWINSGFEGSPSFVQNPGAFFLDLADQLTRQFIGKDLAELCSPFSIDIRIALSFKYRPRIQQRYKCTLGTIIANSKNAIKNASINGFTAGDFKQGGWPAFVSLTTEPRNNIYGAYLQADSDLSFRVASAQYKQQKEIDQGKGFLSWRDPKCTAAAKKRQKINNLPNNGDFAGETTGLSEYQINSGDYGGEGPSIAGPQSPEDCPINTPGTVIADTLQRTLNIPADKLGLADEFGEIVNALFAQLTTKVLQVGLTAITKKDASGSSYLDEVSKDINKDFKASGLASDISLRIEDYLSLAKRYLANRTSSFELVAAIKATYDSAQACYVNKMQNNQPPLDVNEMMVAQSKVAAIQSATGPGTGFYSVYTLADSNLRDAQAKYNEILTAMQQASSSQSVQEVSDAAETFRKLNDPNNPNRMDERNVQTALEDYNNLLTNTASVKTDAENVLKQCQVFPPPRVGSAIK